MPARRVVVGLYLKPGGDRWSPKKKAFKTFPSSNLSANNLQASPESVPFLALAGKGLVLAPGAEPRNAQRDVSVCMMDGSSDVQTKASNRPACGIQPRGRDFPRGVLWFLPRAGDGGW
jgi:hypothetical protein